MKNIKIISDIHGNFKEVSTWLEPDTLYLQVGDFGYWPHIPSMQQAKDLKLPEGSVMYTCMGNHENWDELDKFGYEITEIADRIFYVPFGTILEFFGKKILFVGKAASIDKNQRIPYMSWWPQEVPSYKDIDRINWDEKIDWVISHTTPHKFETLHGFYDPTRDTLDEILVRMKPQKWFAGHFHDLFMGKYENCKWIALPTFPKHGFILDPKEF